MSRPDRLALALSLIAILAALFVSLRIFEDMAHLEDEIAYLWQAQAIAEGHLTLPSPPSPRSFLVPFVVDYEGQRFGKYPLGWPALLAVGVKLGLRFLVNPLLGGLAVWLTYRLGRKIFGAPVGLLAALLTATSPFFLLNSGSLLTHPFGLVLTLGFVIAWLDAFWQSPSHPLSARWKWLAALTAGLCLGALALSRPWTAIGVSLPFAMHGLILLARADTTTRLRVLLTGLVTLLVGSLVFVWQYAVTGDPLLNPYTLWWHYDKVGFGPGVGRAENGHTLRLAYLNTRASLRSGVPDLFGWGKFSWILLPAGLLAALRKRSLPSLLTSSLALSLVLAYALYWVGSWLFGPRYYYEALFSATILSAAGFAFLAGWPLSPMEPWRSFTGLRKLRPLLVTAVFAFLIGLNLAFYTPIRLSGMHGLYGVQRADLAPFYTKEALALTPALIIVHPEWWTDYGALLELQDPFLETPFIFIYTRGPASDDLLAEIFPDRQIFHYYPASQPTKFYTQALPPQP